MSARMIAIYGKGGIGKSFTTSNITGKMAMNGHKVLQLGCDPKHDSCNTIFDGHSLPTLGEVWRKHKADGTEDQMTVSDVIFRSEIEPGVPIYGCEIGGPDVGRGCGGQGISHGFKTLEKLGMSDWDLDYIVMDFLGDVVCGGFATPLARSLAEEIIIVVGHDRQSLYAANNIAKAAYYFQQMGGSTQLLGMIVNRDDGTDTADNFAEAIGLPILARAPLNHEVRVLADACKLSFSVPEFDTMFSDLVERIHNREIPHCKTFKPLEYDEFLEVFNASEPPGAPTSATEADLFGAKAKKQFLPDIDLMPMAAQVKATDPLQAEVQKMMEKIGIHVTGLDTDKQEGVTVISGATEIRVGGTDNLAQKAEFLTALLGTGQAFSEIDVRYIDAPSYQ
ncbi:MAG: chlorophyllide a reductase iron protein subunit X [Chloroflexota bacterium]